MKKEFFFTNSRHSVGGNIVHGMETENISDQPEGEKVMGAYSGKYEKEINAAASKYNLDPFLIAAVIYVESSFNPKAGSSAGAKGLMQLMDGTFKAYGNGDIYNPHDNIFAGSKYLYTQIKNFNSVELGLAAYNSGPARVKAANGIPNITETKNYVVKVTKKWAEYKGGKVIETAAETTSGIKTGNVAIDTLIKSPVLWVALVVAFLIK